MSTIRKVYFLVGSTLFVIYAQYRIVFSTRKGVARDFPSIQGEINRPPAIAPPLTTGQRTTEIYFRLYSPTIVRRIPVKIAGLQPHQAPPPDPQEHPEPVPLSGTQYLLLAGALYGVFKIIRKRKKERRLKSADP